MTAPSPSSRTRPPLPADTPLLTQEDVDVALRFVEHGVPLSECEARFDLGRMAAKFGARPDLFWAVRWGWTSRDVDVLRTSDWRTRPELPTPKGAPLPDRPFGREERERENEKYRRNNRRSR